MGNYHPVSVFPSESKSFEEVIVDKRSLYFLFICKLIASYFKEGYDVVQVSWGRQKLWRLLTKGAPQQSKFDPFSYNVHSYEGE